MTSLPLVTIGILSWNRLHYLRATVESARRCIQYPNLEWIISDNTSVEPGLRDHIQSLDWVQHKWFGQQSHAEAMNEIVQKANGQFLILWPEDVQFTVEGDWLTDLVELLTRYPWLGSLGLNYMRRTTYQRLFTWHAWLDWHPVARDLRYLGPRFRFQRRLRSSRGVALRTFGWLWPGVVGSGIPSLARTDTWRRLGPWRTTKKAADTLIDSSLGAEDDMVLRVYRSGQPWQQAIPIVPVAADIITDPLGTKAKVRRGKRYGVYLPPPEGTFYYRIFPQARFAADQTRRLPLAFEDCVEPLGFTLPYDTQGNLLKAKEINTSVVADL
jgi:hypothetical protein